ncbi:hypothetical protein [Nocardia nepalensis]|uniref:hypothetical protein n=1 Tax=Nocardia nepalensis TaxID=3375448 RepID=UPI003B66B891
MLVRETPVRDEHEARSCPGYWPEAAFQDKLWRPDLMALAEFAEMRIIHHHSDRVGWIQQRGIHTAVLQRRLGRRVSTSDVARRWWIRRVKASSPGSPSTIHPMTDFGQHHESSGVLVMDHTVGFGRDRLLGTYLLARLHRRFAERAAASQNAACDRVGRHIDLGSPDQVHTVLAD